ncbi:hypothetical protein [Corallococcus llansteffanensis]|uniref:Uncharacterized protein n=1 Tax=Corallococcus llansteffanensis TaxID=2316731 RepID=A0A3A8PBH7_9BACT|nr:hypothetical protein [Corallococcus llansteffanensis]RKH53748.1 hypothetical protein D7V93_26390 [Corallococcus llansteffanensis]
MTKINAPTGFISTLKSALKNASTEGKAVGAPAVKKALKGADAGKLDSQQKSQIRDAFERVKLTPKAREIADRFVKGDKKPLNPHDGIKKIRSDDPIRGGGSGSGIPGTGIKKIRSDDPIRGEGSGSGIPGTGIKKIRSDDPIKGQEPGTGIKVPDVIVKIVSDDPIRGDGPGTSIQIPDDIVKIVSDDPIRGDGPGPGIQFPDDGVIVKIISDDPIGGNKPPVFQPPDINVKPLSDSPIGNGGAVKFRMDDPIGNQPQFPDLKPLDQRVVKVKMDSPI